MTRNRYLAQIDWLIFTITLLLALVGISCIYSATHTFEPAFYHKQLYWLFIGLVIIVPALVIDYLILERFAYVIYGLSLITLLFALFFGKTMGGAQRWISLGFISFQPSEFAKVAFVIALARNLSSKQVDPRGMGWKELMVPAVLVLLPFLLVAKQPDLGTALIFLFIFSSMILISKVRLSTLVSLAAAFAAMVPVGWWSLKSYQKARLLSFLDPTMDPLGSGYHTLQSKIAIGSGGFFGKGFTQGTQGSLMFLPAHHTDFIFPILAEEWGFVGSVAVLALFLILIMRGIDTAANSKDRFGFLLAFGITSMLFWHVIINIGMIMGFLPVVGVPLPFLSYGGSFLLTMLIGIWLLMNIRMRRYIF